MIIHKYQSRSQKYRIWWTGLIIKITNIMDKRNIIYIKLFNINTFILKNNYYLLMAVL